MLTVYAEMCCFCSVVPASVSQRLLLSRCSAVYTALLIVICCSSTQHNILLEKMFSRPWSIDLCHSRNSSGVINNRWLHSLPIVSSMVRLCLISVSIKMFPFSMPNFILMPKFKVTASLLPFYCCINVPRVRLCMINGFVACSDEWG